VEIRLNLVLVAVLGIVWFSLVPSHPVSRLDPADARVSALAAVEDGFARDRGNLTLARELADRYLELEEPGLAIATLHAADSTLLEDPSLADKLAQAYEQSGRVADAFATADLALARCARALGARSTATPPPRFDCSEGTYASLDVHRNALERMARWGVSDPMHDARARVAYELSLRTARVAIQY